MQKNKKIFIVLILIIAVTLISLFYFSYNPKKIEKICFGERNVCFKVEIADSLGKRVAGLGNRNFLKNDSGMLFVFPDEEVPGFWMKDMKFPLDMVWIGKNFKIVGVEKNLQPCVNDFNCRVFYPEEKIKYVLEINSGLSEKYNFQKGDFVYLE